MKTGSLAALVLLQVIAAVMLGAAVSHAFQFTLGEDNSIQGSLNTTLTAGFGVRLANPYSDLVGDTTYRANANTAQWSNGDNGNLNYRAGRSLQHLHQVRFRVVIEVPGTVTSSWSGERASSISWR